MDATPCPAKQQCTFLASTVQCPLYGAHQGCEVCRKTPFVRPFARETWHKQRVKNEFGWCSSRTSNTWFVCMLHYIQDSKCQGVADSFSFAPCWAKASYLMADKLNTRAARDMEPCYGTGLHQVGLSCGLSECLCKITYLPTEAFKRTQSHLSGRHLGSKRPSNWLQWTWTVGHVTRLTRGLAPIPTQIIWSLLPSSDCDQSWVL